MTGHTHVRSRSHSAVVAAIFAVLCLAMLHSTLVTLAEAKPVAAERNPPGDIPDDQVFIRYASPLGFFAQENFTTC